MMKYLNAVVEDANEELKGTGATAQVMRVTDDLMQVELLLQVDGKNYLALLETDHLEMDGKSAVTALVGRVAEEEIMSKIIGKEFDLLDVEPF